MPFGIAAAGSCGHEIVEAAAQFRHGRVDREQVFGGHGAQGNDHLRLDCGDLAHQKGRAGLALIALWSAIARRTAFHHVGDVDLFPAQAHSFDHVVEQLSSAAYERFSLGIFVRAGAFAYEHQICMRISHAEYDLLPALLVELATGAVAEVLADQSKRSNCIRDVLLGMDSQDGQRI